MLNVYKKNLKRTTAFFILGSAMRRFLLILCITSLVLGGCFFSDSSAQSQSQDKYSLKLQEFVWSHSTLNALVVTAENESWWDTAFLNTSLRAIGQWNEAIVAFAANYSDFSYLYNLRIQPTVSSTWQPGYDIYINWHESLFNKSTDEVGLSQISANYQNAITNCTVNLAVHTSHGVTLNEGDMQNVALHELGHSLGLGHSNYTGDLMYALYTMGSPAEDVSTLDVYGVATVFAWETNTSIFYPINNLVNQVILPASITYQFLPVSQINSRPQTLANNSVVQFFVLIFEILIHQEIYPFVLLFIVVLVIIAVFPRRRKRVKAGS
jgi:predicted Zn-dependent protease